MRKSAVAPAPEIVLLQHLAAPTRQKTTFQLFFPATNLLGLFGFSKTVYGSCCSMGQSRFRKALFAIYLTSAFIWFLIYSISTFYQQVQRHAKSQELGAKDSSIIIRLLDDISWVSVMLRNILVLLHFFRYSERFHYLSADLEELSGEVMGKKAARLAEASKHYAKKLYWASFFAVMLSFVLCFLYWNGVNFGKFLNEWPLSPIPLSLTYWGVTLLTLVFVLIPFLMAQAILSSVIGLGHGAFVMLQFVNRVLDKMATAPPVDNPPEVAAPLNVAQPDIGGLRLSHFKICEFIARISDEFSGIFLILLVADLSSALGFVGLIIGYKNGVGDNVTFDRTYQLLATGLWMVFFLCAEYWPFVQLHEEAGKTYSLVHALSICQGLTANGYQREITYFLLTTNHAHVGIVGGKLFMFSRNLCATIVSLLVSFGVLLYEILHKDQSGGIVSIIESGVLSSINASLGNGSVLLPPEISNNTSSGKAKGGGSSH